MFRITVTDNNTNTTKVFKAPKSVSRHTFTTIGKDIVDKERESYHQIETDEEVLSHVIAPKYLRMVYNIEVISEFIDGRTDYAKDLEYFDWHIPFEMAWKNFDDGLYN